MAVQTPPPEIIEDEELGFFRRFRIPIILGGLLLIGGIAWSVFGEHKPAAKKQTVRLVEIMAPPPPPPPPPPPTPPPPPPPPDEKPPEFQPEDKPEEKPPEAPPPEAPSLGSNIVGEGDSAFGLTAGGGNGTGLGGQGGKRSKYGWYAGQVQQSVVAALRAHKLTRSASLSLTVRVWADSTGRIVKATLAGSSGTAATDTALQNEILTGLQLAQAPPEGMPMPIVMRISARRP